MVLAVRDAADGLRRQSEGCGSSKSVSLCWLEIAIVVPSSNIRCRRRVYYSKDCAIARSRGKAVLRSHATKQLAVAVAAPACLLLRDPEQLRWSIRQVPLLFTKDEPGNPPSASGKGEYLHHSLSLLSTFSPTSSHTRSVLLASSPASATARASRYHFSLQENEIRRMRRLMSASSAYDNYFRH